MSDDWMENARMLEDSVRAIVPADRDLSRVRECRFSEPGFSVQTALSMVEMGWLHLRLDEADGGLGLGMREYCTLLMALGRGIVPEPIISSALAFRLIAGNLPESVQNGEKLIVTAWQDKPNSLTFEHGATILNNTISGRKVFVEGAAGADFFAIPTQQGVALVQRDHPGLRIELHPRQDGAQMGTLILENAAIELHTCGYIDGAINEAVLAQAAYLFGAAEQAFEITLDYLRIREQFGRPIGSFQAIQHRATAIKVQLELARASIFAAATTIDTNEMATVQLMSASRAKARTSDLFMLIARESVQMHGAIGCTDEADIGLFVRKAMSASNLYGSARSHRSHYQTLLEQNNFTIRAT